MAREKPELPVRVIRERGSQQRRTITHGAKVKTERVIPVETAAKKSVVTHRTNEASRGQKEQHGRRIEFRRIVTEESLRRRRIAAAEQTQERRAFQGEQSRRKFGADIAQGTGVRPASIGVAAGIVRVFVVIFLLSMLFLVVSRGQQTGNAIQKVGFFLNNITSGQPLFKTTKASA